MGLMKSQPVALLGEAPPRVLVKPTGVRANSWSDVADLSATLGVRLDGWQELILRATMGERSDGTWATKRAGISVPRQNGKSQLLVARALAGVLLFGERKIVVSAHQQDTAREAFAKLLEIIEADANGALRARLDPKFGRGGIMNALNREAVRFKGGATIQFKARSGAAGKGFSSDCLLLDEAQILGSRAWTSINSTMSAMPNPQVWLLGTPPQDEDDCFAFDAVRRAAISGQSTAGTWVEWSADPTGEDFDPASEFTRWQANPAWNTRINHEVVDGEYETYTPERFAQDRLGVWRSESGASRLIDADTWDRTGVTVKPDGPHSYGVAFSADGKRVALAGAVRSAAGVHVELIDAHTGDTEAGVNVLADWLAERRHTVEMIAISGREGAALVQALTERRVSKRRMRLLSTGEYADSNTLFLDGLRAGGVTHLQTDGQAALDAAVAVADKEPIGRSGAWRWKATVAGGDKTPVEAVAVAHWAARTSRQARQQTSGKAVFV